jgi:hypothetical protein
MARNDSHRWRRDETCSNMHPWLVCSFVRKRVIAGRCQNRGPATQVSHHFLDARDDPLILRTDPEPASAGGQACSLYYHDHPMLRTPEDQVPA